MIFSHTYKIKIPELNDADTDPSENLQYNVTPPPVSTHPSPSYLPLEDTSFTSAKPPPYPCVEAGDTDLQAREGDLPDILLLSPKYMLYGVYQDWVHQNPG